MDTVLKQESVSHKTFGMKVMLPTSSPSLARPIRYVAMRLSFMYVGYMILCII